MASVYEETLRRVQRNRAYEHPRRVHVMHAARELFCYAIHRVEPRVVSELMDEPLQLYRPMFEKSISRLPEERRVAWYYAAAHPAWGHFACAGEYAPLERRQLRSLLEKWAHKWRLKDEWCLVAAVDTLAQFSAAGDNPEPMPLAYVGHSLVEMPFDEDELRFEFSHDGWEPTLEDWEAAEQILDAAYERRKHEYKRRVEELCEEAGLVKVRPPRAPGDAHLEWLARYQVGRETWTEIATSAKVTDDAVAKAVRAKAAEIGLTLADTGGPGRRPRRTA